MEYDLPIARMARGIDVEGFYLLKSAFSKVTATGKPFLTAVLADESGTIEAKVWDYTGPIGERDVGKAIKIRGSVSDYRGALQITVDKLRLAADDDHVDVSRLVSVAPIDRDGAYADIERLVASIEDPDHRAVCEEMLRRHKAAFRTIPAAKSVHHSFLSGLLMHTYNMLRLADFLAAQYADTVDRSLLLAGTLLHDFGKEQEPITAEKLGANDVYYLPYLMGERSPHNDPAARGSFIGLRMDSTRADMTQAVLEGVAFAIKDCVEIARAQGVEIASSTLCGGGAKSPLWREIMANILGIPLALPQTEQGPGYGGAMLAAVACGEYATVQECADKLIKIKSVTEPDPALVKKYAARYELWHKLYPALKPLYAEMEALQ